MNKPPESYLDARRPPLLEALKLEGGTITEATESLTKKGYYEPPPRPWSLGVSHRGLGRNDYAVLDKFADLVVETKDRVIAELIIDAVNAFNK